jgi:hypothetical protein
VDSPALPEIPVISDFVPGLGTSGWNGIAAPKTTPPEVIEKLNKEINAILGDAKMKGRIADFGGTVLSGSPADFGKFMAEEAEKWGKVIKFASIKPESDRSVSADIPQFPFRKPITAAPHRIFSTRDPIGVSQRRTSLWRSAAARSHQAASTVGCHKIPARRGTRFLRALNGIRSRTHFAKGDDHARPLLRLDVNGRHCRC